MQQSENTIQPPAFSLPAALLQTGFSLRPEDEADIPFLLRLYASTRAAELAHVPWPPEAKDAFLAQQFGAQRHHYRTTIDGCLFWVLEQHGTPAGRLYLDRRRTQWHIVDIALLPDYCGNGTGTALLTALIEAAAAEGKDTGIFVEKYNPALRLYNRLGFAEIGDHGVYWEMERIVTTLK